MKKLSIVVPAAVAGVLVSAMVLAAPASTSLSVKAASAPNRAVAYMIAMSK